MTAVASAEISLAPPPPAVRRSVLVVANLPELIACGMAGFSLPTTLLLLAGQFRLSAVLICGALGAGAAMWVYGLRDARPADARWTMAAVGLATIWTVANSFVTGENLYAHRDPATYNIAARWLMSHHSMQIPTHPEVFGSPFGYDDTSAGFLHNSVGSVYAQGNHLLPALLAVIGRLFGTEAMLRGNVLLSGLALIVFFGLARAVCGGPLALLAMTALAVCIPFLFVARDTYSEPLAVLFLMGGVLLVHRAVRSGRVRDFALAGFVAGSADMVRIDGFAALYALVLSGVVLLVLAPPGQRALTARRVTALLGAAAVPVLIGWVDASELSSGYYHDERHHIFLLFYGGFVLALVGAGVVAISWLPRVRIRLAPPRVRRAAGAAGAAVVVLAFLVLASRPLWYVGRNAEVPYLREVQQKAGAVVDGTRNYAERAVSWQAMYLGWPTVVLGTIGFAILVYWLIARRRTALVGIVAMGGALSALYLWAPAITPDQPWAMRRFVPVVIPVMLIAAVVVVGALWASGRRWLKVVGVLAGCAVVAVPLIVSRPVAALREERGQLAQVRAVCSIVGRDGAVVMVDQAAQSGYGQTLRAYCGVPTIGFADAFPAQLASMRNAALSHGRRLFVMAQDRSTIHYAGAVPADATLVTDTTRWPSTLNRPPRQARHEVVPLYIGRVEATGLAVPVPPA